MNYNMTHILRISTKAAGLAALALVALAPLATHAGNQMNAGAMCVSIDNNLPDITPNAEVQNISSQYSLSLVCPVVREKFGYLTEMSATVFVTDRHYDLNVCCSARSKNAGSSSFFAAPNSCSKNTGSYQSLSTIVPGWYSGSTNDYRYIKGNVPPTYQGNASVIHGFRGQEI